MTTYLIILIYIIASTLVSIEGNFRQLGARYSFIICIIFTPIMGFCVVVLSPKNLLISHYIQRVKCKDCDEFDKATHVNCEKCKHIDNWQLIKYKTVNKLQSVQLS